MRSFFAMIFAAASLLAIAPGDSVDAGTLKTMGVDDSKITIVDFFASWCHACKQELPHLAAVNGKLDKTKVDLVGVNIDDNPQKGAEFSRSLGVNFRVVYDDKKLVAKKFSPRGMPALYYLKGGKVVKTRIGALSGIEQIILSDIAELSK